MTPPAEKSEFSRKRLQTRSRLLHAARQIVTERGIGATTVEAVAEAANFTRGAFYSNFATKEDLIEALITTEFETILTQLSQAIEQETPTATITNSQPADFTTAVDHILTAVPLSENFYLLRSELFLHATRHQPTAALLNRLTQNFNKQLGKILCNALTQIGFEPAININQLTEATTALVEHSFRLSLLSGGKQDVRTFARTALSLLLASATRPIPANLTQPNQ